MNRDDKRDELNGCQSECRRLGITIASVINRIARLEKEKIEIEDELLVLATMKISLFQQSEKLNSEFKRLDEEFRSTHADV